jgi:hypothetical protein
MEAVMMKSSCVKNFANGEFLKTESNKLLSMREKKRQSFLEVCG